MNLQPSIKNALFLLTVAFLYSCAPKSLTLEGDFVQSSRNASEVLDQIRMPEIAVQSITGRARAQYSGPGSSERSAVSFASDRDRTLLIFRNSLGIEGGRLLVEPDSVTLYNRIEQTAQRVSSDNHDVMFDNGFYAVNMLSILSPDLKNRVPRRIYENDSAWRITFDDHVSMNFSKETGDLLQFEYRILNNFAFSTYLFANFMEVSGYRFPRNIQITTNDRRSNIYLVIQSYEVNPPILELSLNIPGHVRIDRP
jgi:hypothetical protein